MKIVFVSDTGDSIGIALRVANEGHSVIVCVNDEQFRLNKVGEGIVPLGPQPTAENIKAMTPDLVVFDMVGFGPLASELRRAGIPVFGGSEWADLIELDRAYGTALMRAVGIKTPPTKSFKTWEEGRAYVRRTGKRLVFKPSGNLDTATTYVSKGPDDMIAMLTYFEQELGAGIEYELQDFVDGVEVSTEGWFNGKEFMHPINSTFEEKKFLEGGLGPNTGCMGNAVFTHRGKTRLFTEGIGRMERVLRASDYRGPLDLNTIVTKDGVYGLEFTARFGYDAVQALLEGCRDSVADLLHGCATGTLKTMSIRADWLFAVRLTVPPYPHTTRTGRGRPVLGINDQNAPHIWPSGLRFEDGMFTVAAPDGVALTVTARGVDLHEARRRAYRTVSNLVIPDVQYRRDIGERVDEDMKRLRAWGWL